MSVRSTNGTEIQMITPTKRNINYDLNDQKRLILLSQNVGNSPASVCREFKIPRSTISGWKNKIDLSLNYQKGQYTMHSGPKCKGEHLEHIVVCSFIDQNENENSECTFVSIVLHILKNDDSFMDGAFKRVKNGFIVSLIEIITA